MDVFFMSVWDQPRMGTKFYVCYGEDTTDGYHTETIPVLWLPDNIANDSEAARVIVELWFSENTYHLSFPVGDGKHLFAPSRRVFELIAKLKRIVAGFNRVRTPAQPLGQIARTGQNEWTMYGAGGGAGGSGGGAGGAGVVGVDVGNGQIAFDMESYGGNGHSMMDLGTALHRGMEVREVPEGEWGSIARSRPQRVRQQRVIVERSIERPLRSELPVHLRFHGGRVEDCSIEHYNEMIDTGVWTGMERINVT